MRQPIIGNMARQYISRDVDIIAPVGGWNTVSNLASMPGSDAIFIDNFWPTPTSVDLRKGWDRFANIPDDDPDVQRHDIQTLMSYTPPSGIPKLWAADQTGIWDVTVGGSVAVVSSVATNAQ